MVGIGLIGLGRHGMRYASHLLAGDMDARLVAASRRDAAQGAQFARTHGVRFHARWADLIADPGVDAVVVVTPPSLAKDICLAAVSARKPMLLEKPLARTAHEARVMVEAAEGAGVPIMTAQTLRFDAAVLALKAARARVGPFQYLALTNRVEPLPSVTEHEEEYGGRGVLLEIGIHLLDLVRFLTDEEVVEVRCELERQPEIRALVSLRTTNGHAALVDVSRVTSGRVSRAEWVGADGQVLVDWVHHHVRVVTDRNRVEEWTVPDRPTVVAAVEAFVAALRSGAPMPITGRDGLSAVELADACYESAAAGKPVRLKS